jgi:hypothetical protein
MLGIVLYPFRLLFWPFRPLWWRLQNWASRLLRQLMQVRFFLFWVTYLRYLYLVRLCGRLRYLEGTPFACENAVHHNIRGIRPTITSDRTLALLRPLSVIETVGRLRQARLLCIGPRSEGEILRAWAHGFALSNIKGLDLISYSPWIDLGDMHKMPYQDSSFEMMICGWVIAYSENRELAAREMVRVMRPGGIVAIGVEYGEESDDETIAKCGYLPGSQNRIQSVEQILSYFGDMVDHIYFNHGIVKGVNSKLGNLLVIFSIKK